MDNWVSNKCCQNSLVVMREESHGKDATYKERGGTQCPHEEGVQQRLGAAHIHPPPVF